MVAQNQTMKERFISDQSVRELGPLLTPNQRAFVSLLATAELHDIDLKHLVTGYAKETGSIAAEEFAELLPTDGAKQAKSHPLDIADKIENLMPRACKVALNSARACGTLHSFYRSWLAQTVDDRSNWVPHENTNAATIGRLALRTLVCVWLMSFILLYVVPEHMKMYEEFGLEINETMGTFLQLSTWLAGIFPLFLLLLFCIALYIICFRRSVFSNYIQRWLPGKWRQVNLPTPIMNRKLMAWDLLAFRGTDRAAKTSTQQTNWDVLVAAGELGKQEAEIMKATRELETQAWLLRNMADKQYEGRKSRFTFLVSSVSILFQALLAAFIILATFSIFSMLLELMRGL